MQTLKRGLVAAFLLFSPLVQAEGLQDQLTAFFAEKLAGFSDDVTVTVRTPPNLYPTCEQPSFSVTGTTEAVGQCERAGSLRQRKTLFTGCRSGDGQLCCCRRAYCAWQPAAGKQRDVEARAPGSAPRHGQCWK